MVSPAEKRPVSGHSKAWIPGGGESRKPRAGGGGGLSSVTDDHYHLAQGILSKGCKGSTQWRECLCWTSSRPPGPQYKGIKKKEKRWQKEKELVVGSSGQPMPQPLQADGTEHGPVTQGPHHMVLT